MRWDHNACLVSRVFSSKGAVSVLPTALPAKASWGTRRAMLCATARCASDVGQVVGNHGRKEMCVLVQILDCYPQLFNNGALRCLKCGKPAVRKELQMRWVAGLKGHELLIAPRYRKCAADGKLM
jgi:hypothetical protein